MSYLEEKRKKVCKERTVMRVFGRRGGWASSSSSWFPTIGVLLLASSASGLCPHPSVPAKGTYENVTGGPEEASWKIKYNCDSGYELFGEHERECEKDRGAWEPEELPLCTLNVASHKPAKASSVSGEGFPKNAVDGRTGTLHEGNQCTETLLEKSPWWTVDLLSSYPVKSVRITTRCCDEDVVLKNAEIRIGDSPIHSQNLLCNWIPKALKQGSTESFECTSESQGRYVSIVMTGLETVLSLCEVEVFSSQALSSSSCSGSSPSIFEGECYDFGPGEITEYDTAENKCSASGRNYHLIHNLTSETTEFVTAQVKTLNNVDEETNTPSLMTWIGAKRNLDENGAWYWSDGSPILQDEASLDWGRGQPNNYNEEQNCAVLDSELDWKWNDISCRISGIAVCQGPPNKCTHPAVNEGTYVTIESYEEGGKLVYHCGVGYMPVGEAVQTCQNGKWSGSPITCKYVDCGEVPGLLDGEIHFINGRTSFGARIIYKCKENYSLMHGIEERVCEENGWAGRAPKCVYTKCSVPEKVTSSYLKEIPGPNGLYSTGTKLIYTCHQGYKALGSLTRECILGGVWSGGGNPPICHYVDCGNPPRVPNGEHALLDARTTFGAEVEYSCYEDFIFNGVNRKKRCEDNSRWTRFPISCDIIQCPVPTSPIGGKVSGYDRTVHSTVEYSCLPGHILTGDTKASCTRQGEWSAQPPVCQFVDCGAVPPVPNGSSHYVNGSTHLGSIVNYNCKRAFLMIGKESRTCLSAGLWNGDPPKCKEIRCPLPPRPNNTVISVSSTERLHGTSVLRSKLTMSASFRIGSTLKYRCERGYILKSEDGTKSGGRVMTRRCKSDKTWTGSNPICEFVDCGLPDVRTNGKFKLANNGTYYGSVSFYSCEKHFNIEGFEKRRCESNGRWMPEAPKCVETTCKELKAPANGTMALTHSHVGGHATFKCNYGFDLKGDNDIRCLSSGSWSSWTPNCLQIDCGKPLNIENGRFFLTNGTTVIDSYLEVHCFPGFVREGLFQRRCGEDGYWNGPEPKCIKPVAKRPLLSSSILEDNVIDGATNVRSDGSGGNDDGDESSNVGLIIGVVLGLIVVFGLMILGVYFYRKQKSVLRKPATAGSGRNMSNLSAPAPFRSPAGAAVGINGYTGVYGSHHQPQPTATVGARPPPPIQMYSMEESPEDEDDPSADHRGPIYDTINDDSTSGGGGSTNSGYPPNIPSTFSPSVNGYASKNNDYDVPEGSETSNSNNNALRHQNSFGTVTINGIAV